MLKAQVLNCGRSPALQNLPPFRSRAKGAWQTRYRLGQRDRLHSPTPVSGLSVGTTASQFRFMHQRLPPGRAGLEDRVHLWVPASRAPLSARQIRADLEFLCHPWSPPDPTFRFHLWPRPFQPVPEGRYPPGHPSVLATQSGRGHPSSLSDRAAPADLLSAPERIVASSTAAGEIRAPRAAELRSVFVPARVAWSRPKSSSPQLRRSSPISRRRAWKPSCARRVSWTVL